jgi:hypothetical protein
MDEYAVRPYEAYQKPIEKALPHHQQQHHGSITAKATKRTGQQWQRKTCSG